MECSSTTVKESGDGSMVNVGILISGKHQCPDCQQKFDAKGAKDIHWNFFHDHTRFGNVTDNGVTCGSRVCEDENITSKDVEEECTICMEPIYEGTVLPCQCKLNYCLACWDKALANSFGQCGQARCPSCRALVHVDYDTAKHCLVFTTETVDMTHAHVNEIMDNIRGDYLRSVDEGQVSVGDFEESFRGFAEAHDGFQMVMGAEKMRQDTIARLCRQAMPTQIKILRDYGEANPSLMDFRRMASEQVGRLDETIDETIDVVSPFICSMWALQKFPAPKCVCGSGCLQRVDGIERVRHSLGEEAKEYSDEYLRDRTRGVSVCICDICEKSVGSDSFVWTCDNRTSSILHATSYDMCEKCFVDSARL